MILTVQAGIEGSSLVPVVIFSMTILISAVVLCIRKWFSP